MSVEITILADPDADDGRTIEVRSLARPSGDLDALEDARWFAGGDREAIAAFVRELLDRHGGGLRECRRCGAVRDGSSDPRSPFVCPACLPGEPGPRPEPPPGEGLEARFIGTGDAFGSGGRRSAAIFLRERGAPTGALLDAGPGCLAGLRAEGLGSGDLGVVILSHFHGDHFGGVPFLELDRWKDRADPIPIWTPPGGADRLGELRNALYPDFPATGAVREFLPGETGELPFGGRAVAFPADHQKRAWAYGWRIELGGRTVVYSGDTAWNPRMIRESAGADLLIHECTSREPLPGHTGHSDLVEAADAITARRVLLVHSGPDVLALADPVFDRAHDGLRVVI